MLSAPPKPLIPDAVPCSSPVLSCLVGAHGANAYLHACTAHMLRFPARSEEIVPKERSRPAQFRGVKFFKHNKTQNSLLCWVAGCSGTQPASVSLQPSRRPAQATGPLRNAAAQLSLHLNLGAHGIIAKWLFLFHVQWNKNHSYVLRSKGPVVFPDL